MIDGKLADAQSDVQRTYFVFAICIAATVIFWLGQ
jgi:hypothetical protein